VVWRSGKLGAAYFDEESQQVSVVFIQYQNIINVNDLAKHFN
jgi:hypothetical protein